jgi:single-strand DNA-binding protein
MITIVGNALNTPEWRRLESSKTLVAKFKVAATSRRYDREHGRWVDGASLRVRVNCWRRLAENVSASVLSGDPLIVTGRMYTRDWIGDDGQRRVSYELDAVAVGHDLSRGQSRFTRQRRASSTTVVDEDDRSAGRPDDGPAERSDGAGSGGVDEGPVGPITELAGSGDALSALHTVGTDEGVAPGPDAPVDPAVLTDLPDPVRRGTFRDYLLDQLVDGGGDDGDGGDRDGEASLVGALAAADRS